MPSVLAYHRPGNLDEASTLLAGPNRTVIGGGTVVVPRARVQRGEGIEVVDLQGVGLDHVETRGAQVALGAMIRLGAMVDDQQVPLLLRDLARRELPSALRNQATIGGTAALAEADSVLFAGLLVHDAEIVVHDGGAEQLATRHAGPPGTGGIITEVVVAAEGPGAVAVTGRTPADTPIVAAVARRAHDGVRLALTGVGPTPVLVDPAQPTSGLHPPADFRGSSAYRLHLAEVLSQRVLAEVKA